MAKKDKKEGFSRTSGGNQVDGGFGGVRGQRSKAKRVEEQVDIQPYPKKGKWMAARFIGPVASYGLHWISFIGGRDNKTKISFPKACLAYDPATQTSDSTKSCPYCDNRAKLESLMPAKSENDQSGHRFQRVFYANAIIRSLQDDPPRKLPKHSKSEQKTGFKEMDSDSWTPVKVLRITPSLAQKIQRVQDLNVVKNADGKRMAYPATDPKYGCDLNLSFDPDRAGTDMYDVQKGESSPLTKEEKAYLMYDLNNLVEVEDKASAKAEVQSLLARVLGEGGDEDEEDEDNEIRAGKKKKKAAPAKKAKPAKKGKKKVEDDEDEDEDDEDEDEDDEDEDEDDEDDDDDDDDEDDDDDDEDDDEDEDDDDDDDDEDEDDEDEDEDDDDEDEDEDEDEDDDDDDDEDEDDDDDDDDEDEKPVKKGKGKKAPAKPAKKAKPTKKPAKPAKKEKAKPAKKSKKAEKPAKKKKKK